MEGRVDRSQEEHLQLRCQEFWGLVKRTEDAELFILLFVLLVLLLLETKKIWDTIRRGLSNF